jgi:hypothetical protein
MMHIEASYGSGSTKKGERERPMMRTESCYGHGAIKKGNVRPVYAVRGYIESCYGSGAIKKGSVRYDERHVEVPAMVTGTHN